MPIRRLVQGLEITKQAVGQLVDALVTRGYLTRTPDETDRRQLIVGLTPRGRAAAATQWVARREIDDALLILVGPSDLDCARRVLMALIELGRQSGAAFDEEGSNSLQSASDRSRLMTEHEEFRGRTIDAAVFVNCSMMQSWFNDVNMSATVFSNVSLQRARFTDINLSGASIEDANITGLRILGYDVEELIRVYKASIASAASGGDDAGSPGD